MRSIYLNKPLFHSDRPIIILVFFHQDRFSYEATLHNYFYKVLWPTLG